MSTKVCQICKTACALYMHINGNICNDCLNMDNRWISVDIVLPEHQQIILIFGKTKRGVSGFGVSTFIDSVKMNEELDKTNYAHVCDENLRINKYY